VGVEHFETKIMAFMRESRHKKYLYELYRQTELLYNNSMNMICHCRNIYSESRDGNMEEKENACYGLAESQ
jgi:hypothetical protein